MKVAGFGFRKNAGVSSLRDALDATDESEITAIATVEDKAHAGCLNDLARELNVPLMPVPKAALADVSVQTQSERSQQRFGTGSLAEASSLLAAGTGARLTVARVVSADGMATCAIAEGSCG